MKHKKKNRLVVAISVALIPYIGVTGDIPDSFRDLWGEQDEFYEVKLYGQTLGIHRIKTTPTHIKFYSPESILDKINLKKEKEKELSVFFTNSFSRNGNMSCQGNTTIQYNCNYIKTKSVDVIVDDVDNVVNLFIGNEFLDSEAHNDEYHQLSRNVKKAFIQSQTINVSDSGKYKRLSISGNSALGITDTSYAVLNWWMNYNKSNGYSNNEKTINSLYFRHDLDKRYYYQFGRMDRTDLSQSISGSFNFNLLPLPDIDGIRTGTTQSYIKNKDKFIASPVTVMLTNFSRVEAFRNDQLLGVWYLDSGVNELDTARLPYGSYDLKLKIFENTQLVREEIIPFNKGRSSIGDMQWDIFVQGGNIVNDNDRYIEKQNNHKSSINTGLRLPITKNISVQQGVSVIDNKSYYEGSLKWNSGILSGSLNSEFSFLWGDNAKGNYQSISYTDGFSLSFYHNDKRVDNCGRNYNAGWSGCYESYSASLSIPLLGWTSTLGYSDTYSESVYKSHILSEYGFYNQNIYKGRTQRWQLTSSTSLKWMDYNFMPAIGIYNSEQRQLTDKGGYISVTITRASRENSLNTGYSYNYSRGNYSSNELFVDGYMTSTNNGDYHEAGMRFNKNRHNAEGRLSGRINNRFGDLNGSFSMNKNRNTNSTNHSLTGGYNSSFALTSDGFYWGGSTAGLTKLAGGIIKVKSNDTKKNLVKVTGTLYGDYSLGSNDNAFIPVPALTPASLIIEDNNYGDNNISILAPTNNDMFMLPGNVYPVEIETKVSVSYIGRGFDPNGTPLSGAHVLNEPHVILDEDGGFSFEYTGNEKTLFLLKGRTIYTCQLGKNKVHKGIVFVGDVICDINSTSSLPDEFVKNPRVQDLLAKNDKG
ncbi:CFA/I pilus usher protein CfaC [Escherichia coli]|uniref:CFA/I pilus usher protein CfaC n=1 Tax=Escherichia coli TaxID=562 RepID=UPI000B50B5A0|nr:CFA/I pilus usher protein CfaC [Escherichia coli]